MGLVKLVVHFLVFNYGVGFEISAPFTAITNLVAQHTYCKLYECCGPDWIFFNDTGKIFFIISLRIINQIKRLRAETPTVFVGQMTS